MSTTDPLAVHLVVLAKAPVAGRSKTRLTPPLSPSEAAEVAGAALRDTLTAVVGTPVAGRTIVLDGAAGDWLPVGVDVLPQGTGTLGDRLDSAFRSAYATHPLPVLLIGMDTPQVSAALLSAAAEQLLQPGVDAVLGAAEDGGWWALGLRRPAPGAFDGVPMSTDRAGAVQRDRLVALGLSTVDLPVLRDIDHVADLAAVAAAMDPGSHLARLAARLQQVAA